MMRKGQKSLEMIVGMVILLVVASVVISMFLNIFQEPDVAEDTLSMSEIELECQEKCSTWKDETGSSSIAAAIDYCTSRFSHDANGDGTVTDVAGSGRNSYCEDGVHCFNVQSCEKSFEELDANKCRELMCEYYQDPANANNPSQESAGERIYAFFEPGVAEGDAGAGTCGINEITDDAGFEQPTWWSQNFGEGENGNFAEICEGFAGPSGPSNNIPDGVEDGCNAANGNDPVEVNGEYCHDDPLTVQNTQGAVPIDNSQINDQNIWDTIQNNCPSGTQAISCSDN